MWHTPATGSQVKVPARLPCARCHPSHLGDVAAPRDRGFLGRKIRNCSVRQDLWGNTQSSPPSPAQGSSARAGWWSGISAGPPAGEMDQWVSCHMLSCRDKCCRHCLGPQGSSGLFFNLNFFNMTLNTEFLNFSWRKTKKIKLKLLGVTFW